MHTTRRDWLTTLGLTAAAFKTRLAARETSASDQAAAPGSLVLSDFRPKSMLHVPETDVPRARFPVVDVHCHVARTARARCVRGST